MCKIIRYNSNNNINTDNNVDDTNNVNINVKSRKARYKMNTIDKLAQVINDRYPGYLQRELHNDDSFDFVNIVISKEYNAESTIYRLEGYGLEGYSMNTNRNELEVCEDENAFIQLINKKFEEEFGKGLDKFNIRVFHYNLNGAFGKVKAELNDNQLSYLYPDLIDSTFNEINKEGAIDAYYHLGEIALGISQSRHTTCSDEYRDEVLALFSGEVESIRENGLNDKQKEKLEEFAKEKAKNLSITKYTYDGQKVDPHLNFNLTEEIGRYQTSIEFTIRAFGHDFPIVGSIFRNNTEN